MGAVVGAAGAAINAAAAAGATALAGGSAAASSVPSIGAVMTIGAAEGAAGSLAEYCTEQALRGESVTLWGAASSVLVGGTIGSVTAGVGGWVAGKLGRRAARKMVKEVADETAEKALQRSLAKSTDKQRRKRVRKAVQEAAERAAQEAAEKVPGGSKEQFRRYVQKATQEAADKAAQREILESAYQKLAKRAKPKSVGKYLADSWHQATFPNRMQSDRYHLAKHGKGRTARQYTRDAMEFFEKSKQRGKEVILKDGTRGIKIQTKIKIPGQKTRRIGGYWTESGRLVTYWD
jgi:hypothetical protein